VKIIQKHNIYIAVGFLVILTSVALISYIGISRIKISNTEFRTVIKHHNIQSIYATKMRDAARKRMMELWRISLTEEPFARNESFEDFLNHGSEFIQAREEFVATGLSEQEKVLYKNLLKATSISSNYHRKLARQFINEQPISIREMLDITLPSQKNSLNALNKIIDLQVQDNDLAFKSATRNIEKTVFIMVAMTTTTILIGFIFALVYIKHNIKLNNAIKQSNNELEQINHHLEFRVKERTQQLLDANNRLQSLAHHDTLTGLANRALLAEQMHILLSQAQRDKKKIAMLFIDLDGFKPINDKYGHDFGDQILIVLSLRLTSHIRGTDLVARIGGDEFVIVLSNIHENFHATTFAKMINATLKEPIEIDGIAANLSASIGLSIYPDHADNTLDLLKCADIAMYDAKRSGKNKYSLFNDKMTIEQQA